MIRSADAVVIGAGPNGLVAANLLADAGWDVVVLEAQPDPGGAVRSAQLLEPGFTHDLCSGFYPLTVASPVFARLELERHGLTWVHAPLVLANPTSDGRCAVLSRDLDETAAALDADHPGDGDAWRDLVARWRTVRDGLLRCLCSPMPPVRGALQLLRALGVQELARFARFALLPVRRLGQEAFGGESGRLLLAGTALHADLAPEVPPSGALGWLLTMIGQVDGWPVPRGGAGELTGALVRRLEAAGGELFCATPVVKVVLAHGRAVGVKTAAGERWRARRAVVGDVDAVTLYRRLVGDRHLPPRLLADLERFQWDDATVKVDWTLDAPIPWTAVEARRAGTVHLADSVDELTVTAGQLARGVVPGTPFVVLGQQQVTDPTRQPPGRDAVWAYTHVPRGFRGDATQVADRIQDRIEGLAPGFGALIRARAVLGPAELEALDANLSLGAIGGGTAQLHQQLFLRPTPGLGRAETPFPGLYLGSASAHPGGGVHGAPGSNAARAALWHARLRGGTVGERTPWRRVCE